MPLATRRGGTTSVGATSAWTSTSSGRVPSIAQSTTEPGSGGRLADEAGRGVLDLDEAGLPHLEDPELAGRAEAVLERPQRPVGALALALEEQHAIDEVLEDPRARDRPLLGHVTDEDQGGAVALADLHQGVGGLAHLRHRARGARQLGGVQRLDRVDDAGIGTLRLDRRRDGGEIGLGQGGHREGTLAEPLGPHPDLRRRLLAGHVEDGAAGCGEVTEGHRRDRALADPRRAAEQDERAGDEPAAEDAVELADAGPEPLLGAALDVAQRDRAGAAGALAARSDRRTSPTPP